MAATASLTHGRAHLLCALDGRSLHARLTHADVDLRASLLQPDEHRLDADEQRIARDLTLNETTLAPRAIRADAKTVTLTLETSTFARYQAAVAQWGAIDEGTRAEAVVSGPLWSFSHSLGVNMTLETGDGFLLFTRRAQATFEEGTQLAPAMNEGAHVDDVRDGQWSPETTALRGFEEELGLDRADLVDEAGVLNFFFHSVVTQLSTAGISVLGHARTSLSADQVLKAQQQAVDGWEAEHLFTVENTADERRRLADLGPDHWVDWGLPALAGVPLPYEASR